MVLSSCVRRKEREALSSSPNQAHDYVVGGTQADNLSSVFWRRTQAVLLVVRHELHVLVGKQGRKSTSDPRKQLVYFYTVDTINSVCSINRRGYPTVCQLQLFSKCTCTASGGPPISANNAWTYIFSSSR